MHSTSSRKGQTSITHLMNFSLPPRPQAHQPNSRYASGRPRRNPTWGLGSGYHAVDKARYVFSDLSIFVYCERMLIVQIRSRQLSFHR